MRSKGSNRSIFESSGEGFVVIHHQITIAAQVITIALPAFKTGANGRRSGDCDRGIEDKILKAELAGGAIYAGWRVSGGGGRAGNNAAARYALNQHFQFIFQRELSRNRRTLGDGSYALARRVGASPAPARKSPLSIGISG